MKILLLIIAIIGGIIYAVLNPYQYTNTGSSHTLVLHANTKERARSVPTASPSPTPDIDRIVDKESKRFGVTNSQKNALKVKLHFLLFKESGYGSNKGCGDSGLACGPLQFHEPTYLGFRKIMLAQGLIKSIGDRHDIENAIETTAWAIADGRELNWGPILRGEIQL